MADRWYSDRNIQAALIGGTFLLLSAVVGGYFATRKPAGLPPLEIKTIAGGKEQVLATLALRPDKQVIDSGAFDDLFPEYLLISDTFGIAIKRPTEHRWMAGKLSKVGGVSLLNVPLIGAYSEEAAKMWGVDTAKINIPVYGVRLDQPFEVIITTATRIGDIPAGSNPFAQLGILKSFEDYNFRDEPSASWFDRLKFREEILKSTDSVIQARLPDTTRVYSGVFVLPITEEALPKYAGLAWHYLTLFDKVALSLSSDAIGDRLVYVDRERGITIQNESVDLHSARIDGVDREGLVVNRVGYSIQVGKVVYLVILQYLSGQDQATLNELQEYFRSVRIRRE
ncbi:MAG: hypothetical protein ACREMZ_11410 [Gemmatimonadales bacterium]